MKTAAAYTLGCKVNQYDTRAMCEIMERAGYLIVDFDKKADVYIINTCTVTNMADKKSRQIIARAKKKNPDAVICVCGCLAQRSAEEILNIDGVSCVIGTNDRNNIANIIEKAKNKKINAVCEPDDGFDVLSVSVPGEKTRANIKIQEGCDNYCSYCIIPFVRGHERSRALEDIIREAETLSRAGVCETVLTGIHVSSYSGGGKDLAEVVAALNGMEGIKRIRLGSLEQGVFTEDFVKRLAESEKLCPHFHISLQSGSEKILRAMNRHYTPADFAGSVKLLRKYFDLPAVTTDIITGFPGETEHDFEKTCRFVSDISFSRIHVFPFSERDGTKAAEMPEKIPMAVRRERAGALIDIGKELEYRYMDSMVGRYEKVLFEQYNDRGLCEGYTARYVKVEAKAHPGELKKVLLAERKGDIILAT